MTTQEIMDMQNKIALKEFETNYNQPEYVRCLNDMNNELEYVKLAKQLEKTLSEQLRESIYEVRVGSGGTIEVVEPIIENGMKMKRIIKNVFPTILKQLPYAYVMGKKVGKKVMQELVKKYS